MVIRYFIAFEMGLGREDEMYFFIIQMEWLKNISTNYFDA